MALLRGSRRACGRHARMVADGTRARRRQVQRRFDHPGSGSGCRAGPEPVVHLPAGDLAEVIF